MRQVKSKSARMLYVFIILAGILVVSACGNSSKTEESAAPSAPAAEVAASATPVASVTPEATSSPSATETKVYKDTSGDITIPKNPQRIVELTGSYSGNLLVLGIKPIGLTQSALDNPYFKGKVDGIES